jgi:hypothetical protein
MFAEIVARRQCRILHRAIRRAASYPALTFSCHFLYVLTLSHPRYSFRIHGEILATSSFRSRERMRTAQNKPRIFVLRRRKTPDCPLVDVLLNRIGKNSDRLP